MKLPCSAFALLLLLPAGASMRAQPAAVHPQAALTDADRQTFEKGTEALQANHLDEAIAAYTEVTRHAPHFAEAYLNLGIALSQASRNEDAAAALERATALRPSLRGAHLFLAISDYNLTRLPAASAAIRKETALNPTDAQAWMWQGIIDLAREDLVSAVEALDRAAALDPKNVDILYHRGRAALALSRQSYETMFQVDPHSWHVSQVLAEADVEQGKDAEAVEQFQAAIAAAPPQSGLYEAMGSALWRTGKYQEAQDAYEAALKIDPADTLTMYKLGCLRVDRGDAKGGKPLLERVRLADPSLKLTGYYLGRADGLLGDDQAAVREFRQVIAENVDADTTRLAYFQLSRAYRRLHDEAASAAAQAQYRVLDGQLRSSMQAKVQRQLRAGRNTSIPAPAETKDEAQP